MLFLSKHIKNKKRIESNLKGDKIAEHIVRSLLAAQLKAAKLLQNKFAMLPVGSQKLFVIAFCMGCFTSSVYLMIKSFSKYPDHPISIAVIKVLKPAGRGERQRVQPVGVITKEDFEKIKQFRKYLDTLDKSEQGKRIRQSIMMNRPGLIDSLSTVENMYQLQSPNK